MTLPPAARAAFTSPAVVADTSYRSGYGGSCASCEATPVCRTSGANCTPRLTSRATSSAVKGRPALGISAEPDPSAAGTANTV